MTTRLDSKSTRTKESSATDHQEIEWQFDADELESVEGWLDQHNSGSSGLVVAPESPLEITDTYCDTDDWRFYKSGYALRVRSTDGEIEATMKSLTPAEGSLHDVRKKGKRLRYTLEAKDLRSVVPGSKRFRTMTKGKKWKKFEKAMESRNEDTR
jgi:triphosphatase